MATPRKATLPPEYFSYIEDDETLHAVIAPALDGIRNLSAEQIDTLVFYLKSLHSYYPGSENSWTERNRFSERLKAVGDSPEQRAMQNLASRQMLWAIGAGGFAIATFAIGVLTIAFGPGGWGAVMLAAAVCLFFFAEARFGSAALKTAKDQDRRYFLNCIRIARGCNELDWAGLFAQNGVDKPGPQTEEDLRSADERIAYLTRQLRDAVYNDEYMSYSSPRAQQ